jgi:hypothetical protein
MDKPAPRTRPPDSVAFVARTHWLVGAVALASFTVLFLLTRNLPRVAVGPHTYQIAGGITLLYLVGGTTVWFGTPLGRFLSHVCGLLYLVRPQLGDRVWRTMRSEEFKAHFRRHR